MRIAILVEGKTEKAFMPSLRNFISSRLQQMPQRRFLRQRLPVQPESGTRRAEECDRTLS